MLIIMAVFHWPSKIEQRYDSRVTWHVATLVWVEWGVLNINLTPEVGVTPDGGVGGVNLDTRAISALQVGVVVVGMNVTLLLTKLAVQTMNINSQC